MIVLWIATAYLSKEGKYILSSLITAIPAAFMTAVSVTYILIADEGFHLDPRIDYPVGVIFALAFFLIYVVFLRRYNKSQNNEA